MSVQCNETGKACTPGHHGYFFIPLLITVLSCPLCCCAVQCGGVGGGQGRKGVAGQEVK